MKIWPVRPITLWPPSGPFAAIRGGVHILTLQARMGRTVEGLPEVFREWPIDFGHTGYLVRYRVDAAAITILAVWHQKEVTGEE